MFARLPPGDTLLRLAIGLMVVAAAIRVPYEFWRLLLDTGHWGAIDLRIISTFVADWFAGRPATGTYPPASYVLLWPFLGWLPFPQLRWAWAASVVVLLVWLIRLLERASGLKAPLEKAWLRLFLLSNYATVVVIGNGQLAIHLLPLLLTGIFLLHAEEGGRGSPGRELAAAMLLLAVLIKPSLSAPFFWVALFACGAYRVVIGTAAAYVGLTLAAVGFRQEDLVTLIRSWLDAASGMGSGYNNLRDWSTALGQPEYGLPLSIGLLAVWGVWVFARRRADLWVLLGATALVARVWTYHRLYDDLLLLLPMVALLRIRQTEIARENGLDRVAVLLIGACWLGMMGPGTLLQAPGTLGTLYRAGQAMVWAAMLGLLIHWAHLEPAGSEAQPMVPG